MGARSDLLVGVTEARERLKELLEKVGDRDVVVLRRNAPVAVMMHPDRVEKLWERIEELEDYVAVLEEKLEPEGSVPFKKSAAKRELIEA